MPETDDFHEILEDAPPAVNREAILAQWHAVQDWFEIGSHTFPKPIWVQRSYEHSGTDAWRELLPHIEAKKPGEPLSIYVHVPFCRRRCGFCDLFSWPLPKDDSQAENGFVDSLVEEIAAWSSVAPLAACPVTTVHFGGGTPNCLTNDNLARIVEACGKRLAVSSETEWALESTCRLLTDDHLRELADLGFTRLHAGVQTLNDEIRKLIGRTETGDTVVERLEGALHQGFVVSVDLIYGLPKQEMSHFASTLERLTATGIHGASLYQLQVCDKNRAFLERRGAGQPNNALNYAMFQAGDHYLTGRGYHKNFFTHFARPEDNNLYYRHVLRGEDLLALGPTADGVFGTYLYRHPDYREYLAAPPPRLEGGMVQSTLERAVRPAKAELMTGEVRRTTFEALNALPLLDLWTGCNLLLPQKDGERMTVSANGSWFMTQMVDQLQTRVANQPRAAVPPGT